MLRSTDILKKGRRGDREYTGEEVTRPAVSASG